jgi:hypothetical protein
MKLYILIFVSLIFSSKSKEENQIMSKRLTYKESFDPNNIYYILDSQEEFKLIKNLQKNEKHTLMNGQIIRKKQA